MKTRSFDFDQIVFAISKNWIWAFTLFWSFLIGLPFIAPVFMKLGWETPANIIYTIYSFLCHQLPQRSFFLFGSEKMYSLETIQQAYQFTNNPLLLRKFIGTSQLGWKVAWSDRMISMYTMILPAAWIWYAFRKRIKTLPFWGFIIFLLPMIIDGGTHLISELGVIGQGFRDSNLWLANLTNNQLPVLFYYGDAIGSFNSWMRLITGILFAFGIVWFGFPMLEESFTQMSNYYEKRFKNLEMLENQIHEKLSNIQ